MEEETAKTEARSLKEFELGLFIHGLKLAAGRAIGADRISQLRGFQDLSEDDQVIVSQRAEQLRADRLLHSLENEWRRQSFDQLIIAALGAKSDSDFERKYEANIVFQSVLRLASEQKWHTLAFSPFSALFRTYRKPVPCGLRGPTAIKDQGCGGGRYPRRSGAGVRLVKSD
jgi:hypothetical protein